MPTREELKYYQSLPLDMKIAKTKDNIREFVREFGVDDVYVSFSGGKDSTVLLDILKSNENALYGVLYQNLINYTMKRKTPLWAHRMRIEVIL